MKKQYPVIEVPASGKPNWYEGAYTICYVYSKHHGNFILKGYRGEVEKYLKKNYTHYFANVSMWHQGKHRDVWHFWKDDIGMYRFNLGKKKFAKFEIYKYGSTEDRLTFKRLPKCWIKEFDNL